MWLAILFVCVFVLVDVGVHYLLFQIFPLTELWAILNIVIKLKT